MATGYDGTRKNVVPYTKEGTGCLFWVDADGVERIVGSSDVIDDRDDILASDSSVISTGSWPSGDGDTGALVGGTGHFTVPKLRRVCLAEWLAVGEYKNPTGSGPNPTTINAQLVVNEVAVGSVLSWLQNTAVTDGGRIIFDARLMCCGIFPTPTFIIEAGVTVLNASAAVIISSKQYLFPTLNSLANVLIGWQLSKNPSGTGAVMNLHSWGCYQPLKTKGAC